MEASSASKWFWLCILLVLAVDVTHCNVTYDRKALIINGQRRVLFSGSIHYPRSTPDMWEGLIQKAKDGGLDAIDTYVFWNVHEPSPGNFNFEGRYDLVRFIKLVQKAELYVHLRIGPYICAEWNFGGFPVWLKYVPGISFRTDNEPFKMAMQRFTQKIVQMMKNERLFQSQGGPIILSQIENEYGPESKASGAAGRAYINWAAKMAVELDTGVPWVMCKEDDAPDPVINTCNGFYCDYFSPNKAYKPTIWTEAWTGWFEDFGGPIHHRPVEDLAFAIARFIQKGGSFLNYYMYHGGTNFERATRGPLITTSYDYDAPIDEYGLIRQPKYDHLKELHKAIKLCEHALVSADPNFTPLGNYEQDDSQLVRSCIVGQIYDSGPVDFTSDLGPRFNLHLSVFKMPGSAKLVSLVVKGVSSRLDTSFITRFGSQRTDYWQSLYSSVSLGAPFLILFSNFDDLAPYPIICKFSRRIQDAGGAEIGAYEQRLWKKGHFG